MHDFEFLRYVTVGQYLATGSPLHRLDPRTRLVGGALLLIAVTAAPQLAGLGLALGITLLALLAARVPLNYALRGLLPPLPFIGFLAVLQMLIGPQADTLPLLLTLGPIHISGADLLASALLVARFAALILLISLSSAIISTSELVHGLQSLLRPLTALGLPTQDVVLMMQVTLRFLPLLALEAEHIAKAQASRGAEWGVGKVGLLRRIRQTLPLLVPLFLNSLQRAEALALAMEARGYYSGKGRTSMTELHFRAADVAALSAALALSALILLI